MRESEVIERLRRIATAPEARGLRDDVAVLDGFVITHDTIAEGVHFLPFDPPASVGWKLVAVNLSDLAAKGATPRAWSPRPGAPIMPCCALCPKRSIRSRFLYPRG